MADKKAPADGWPVISGDYIVGDPESPVGSYPGREGSYVTAGLLTNVVYGFLLATFIIFAALPLLQMLGVL